MNQANWEQVKEIFHQALELPPAERDRFVKTACAGDEDLRQQVGILLESYESGFLEETAVNDITGILVKSRLSVGQLLTRFKIRKLLGVGGMGEVFLAEDIELKRPVAIKVLHSEVAEDKERVSRFIQEARAASALNHPNILTIHEIGKQDEIHFIVSEFIEGETLRERLKKVSLSVEDSLSIAEQVAAALSAAHNAGIVHRDIKPENIMLRGDEFVKVLDFGLAKLTEIKSDEADSEASTMAQVRTNPGVVMGTVAYMSPEQARGQEVDRRTDIWSLGVVFYEMLSGKLPFPGGTTSDIIASILKSEVEPLENLKQEIPKAVESICFKALAKDAHERYQTAQEFLQDLRQAKKQLENANEKTATKQFNYSDEQNTELIRHRPTSSAEYLVSQVREHKVGFSVLLGILILTLGGGIGSYWLLSKRNQANLTKEQSDSSPQTMKISRLTTTGRERNGTISPDGKYLVYVSERDGMQSLMLRQIASSNMKEIVPPAKVKFSTQPRFSPDGNFIYYTILEGNEDYGTIYRVSILGGNSVRLISSVDTGLSLSPDGKQIAYTYQNYTAKEMGVRVSLIDDLLAKRGEPKTIFVAPEPKFLAGTISWSPDGNTLACIVGQYEVGKENLNQIVAIDPAGQNERVLTRDSWVEIASLVWLKDSKELLFTGKKSTEDPRQIWRINEKGEITRITNDLNKYSGLSLPADNSFLVTNQNISQTNVLIGDVSSNKQNLFFEETGFKQIPQEIDSGIVTNRLVAFTPDGRIIYKSAQEGKQLFIMNADGSNNRQLTFDSNLNPSEPAVSPDGRFVAFRGTAGGFSQIWRVELENGSLKQLTNNTSSEDIFSNFMFGGQFVFYPVYKVENDTTYLRKISIEGGSPNEIRKMEHAAFLGLSPDEKLIALMPRTDDVAVFGIVSLMDEQSKPKLFYPQRYPFGVTYFVDWTADSRAFIYLSEANGAVNLKVVPVDGGKPYDITNFRDGRIKNFVFSPD